MHSIPSSLSSSSSSGFRLGKRSVSEAPREESAQSKRTKAETEEVASESSASQAPGDTLPVTTAKSLSQRITDLIGTFDCDLQMTMLIQSEAAAVGGPAMTEADCRALVAQILDPDRSYTTAQIRAMMRTLVVAAGGPEISAANLNALFTWFLDGGGLDSDDLSTAIEGVVIGMGGRLMTTASLNKLFTALEQLFSWTISDIEPVLEGATSGLGGRDMSVTVRTALFTHIADITDTFGPLALFELVKGVGSALGGRTMTETNRSAFISQVLNPQNNSEPNQRTLIVRLGVGTALEEPAMIEASRDALLGQILGMDGSCDPVELGKMIKMLTQLLGGQNIREADLIAILRRILASYQTYSDEHMNRMIFKFGQALGGAFMTESNRSAFLTQILEARSACNAKQLTNLIYAATYGLDGYKTTESVLTAWFNQILETRATCTDDQLGAMIIGFTRGLNDPGISASNRATFFRLLEGAYATCSAVQIGCMIKAAAIALGGDAIREADLAGLLSTITNTNASPELMQVMIYAVVAGLGGNSASESHRVALLSHILGAHAACSAEQLCKMLNGSGSYPTPATVSAILRSGASPAKKGLMIAATMSNVHLTQPALKRISQTLGATLAELESEASGSTGAFADFVQAGYWAAAGDMPGIAQSGGLDDGTKLKFIQYLYSLRPVEGSTSLLHHAEYGKLESLQLGWSLKAQIKVQLVSLPPPKPGLFEATRNWLLGILSVIGDPDAEGGAAFGTWHAIFHELYNEFSKYMDLELIEKEQALIAGNRILPQATKESIRALLESSAQKLRQAGAPEVTGLI